MFYDGLYNAFSQLFDGAPLYVFDYVIPIIIIVLFSIVLLAIIWIFIKLPYSILKKSDSIEIEENKPRKRKRFK